MPLPPLEKSRLLRVYEGDIQIAKKAFWGKQLMKTGMGCKGKNSNSTVERAGRPIRSQGIKVNIISNMS